MAAGLGLSGIFTVLLPKALELKAVQHALGWSLELWKVPALPFVGWMKIPALKYLAPLLVLLLIWAAVGFLTFIDRVLSMQDDSMKSLAKLFSGALDKIKSTDRRLYFEAKAMSEDQVKAITGIGRAIADGGRALTPDEQEIMDQALAIGKGVIAAAAAR